MLYSYREIATRKMMMRRKGMMMMMSMMVRFWGFGLFTTSSLRVLSFFVEGNFDYDSEPEIEMGTGGNTGNADPYAGQCVVLLTFGRVFMDTSVYRYLLLKRPTRGSY